MNEPELLRNIVLAPWIYKSTALIGKPRKIGGNQFRHNMATMTILIDYHMIDPVLLKASVIHDLIEDVPETDINDLLSVDGDSEEVVRLVLEVTREAGENKEQFLNRILMTGSRNAKLLKCADRISNLTDLHWSTFTKVKVKQYLSETEKYILPMAMEVNPNMVIEISDLIGRRREMLKSKPKSGKTGILKRMKPGRKG